MSIFTEILKVKKPEKDLVDSLLASYESIAKAKGFEVKREGKTLFFKGERISAVLRIEFGGRRDFFETITYMNATSAEYKVLVVSSNARALPMEAAYTVLKKKLLVKEKWMIIDIEGSKQPMYINWSISSSQPAAPSGAAQPELQSEQTQEAPRPTEERGPQPYYERPPERRRSKPVRQRRKIIYGAPDERKEQD